ncbi:MAG TPA: hypothetical protein VLF21_00265 [Candidatus Saccharimonadales bacterium]|nr:hypothetical protein [Candidatus Saccharimonadales bacterium]
MQPHTLSHQPYDVMLHGVPHAKGFTALRLADAHHQSINVGDLVHMSGHNTFMDRQKFRVVAKMDHPDIASAVSSIQHSNLSARDKIQLANNFRGIHGAHVGAEAVGSHPVVALHLEPHPGPSGYNRPPGAL